MIRFVCTVVCAALVVANCDCGDDNGSSGGTGPTPDDTIAAEVDTKLIGTWHRYDASGAMVARDFARITRDSFSVTGFPVLTGVADPDPLFARVLVAGGGQVYFDPGCEGCPNEYFFDYALARSDSVLYVAWDTSSTMSTPSATTPNVAILRRDTSVTPSRPLAVVSDSLLGAWDLYDTSGTVLERANYLRVYRDSIVLDLGTTVTFRGYSDPNGFNGRTLYARDGQVWYDYHWDANTDLYQFDYSLAQANSVLYWVNESSNSYTAPVPEPASPVKICKRH